jgi:CheB methylesterase
VFRSAHSPASDKHSGCEVLASLGSSGWFSAGGVGALSTLVSTLHKDFPAPIVLARHLDPQRPSYLGSILERRSNLPIVVVSEESPTILETGSGAARAGGTRRERSATNKRFGAMNKELQDANEELQAANEELMLTQEELQATNEELQTTNDELSARTLELQELMKHHGLEQLQLSHLLERFRIS